MSDYKEQVNLLLEHADLIETSGTELYGPSAARLLVYDLRNAAAAIEELQATIELMKPFMPDFFPDANKMVLPKLEPKRGEWKPFDLTYGRSIYSCSVCEQATEVPVCMEKPMYAYCPNCGAKMTEVQDDS